MRQRNPIKVAGNLPAALTRFVGRRREIDDVRRMLAESRLVTLTGVGGVGKTRLALEVAGGGGRAFADGVWLVDLAAVRDPALATRTVVTSLGIPDQSARSAEEQLFEYLDDRQAPVVLDNCEHLLDACARVVRRTRAGRAHDVASPTSPSGSGSEILRPVEVERLTGILPMMHSGTCHINYQVSC